MLRQIMKTSKELVSYLTSKRVIIISFTLLPPHPSNTQSACLPLCSGALSTAVPVATEETMAGNHGEDCG